MNQVKSYEQMTGREFWAEVREILETCQRHHPGTPWTDHVGQLDAPLRAEIDRREPDLSANRAEAIQIGAAAWNRELASGTDILDCWHLDAMTEAERARSVALWGTYRAAVADLAWRHTQPEEAQT